MRVGRDPAAFGRFLSNTADLLGLMRRCKSRDYTKEMRTLKEILGECHDRDRFTVKQERAVERIRRKHQL